MNLENLKNNRDDILKAEIGSLLFNLGKTHIGFWNEKNGEVYFNVDENQFKSKFGFDLFNSYVDYYKKNNDLNKSPFQYELESKGLINFLDYKIRFPLEVLIDEKNNIKSQDINFIEFFKGNASEIAFINKIFFRGCENINSGIDKGSPKGQLKDKLWISNAFGNHIEDVKEEYFDDSRLKFFENLHNFLESNNFYDTPNWQEIKNFVVKKIKEWYSNLLSDSRFPVNDVTLYDQAYMSASMFKATLANIYINNSSYNRYIENPSSIKWKILAIQYDKLGLAQKSLKLASIEWYKQHCEKVDNKIKEYFEDTIALANEIYRDNTGVYFLVGEDITKELIKNDIYQIFEENFKKEIYPYITLTTPSRGIMSLGQLLEEAKKNFLIKSNIKIPDINEENVIGICPICQIRLVTKEDLNKANNPAICNICDNRIHHYQVKEWNKEENNTREVETIWIDEVSSGSRIALIKLHFDLNEWLNGDLLNSLLRNYEKKDISTFLSKIIEINKAITEIQSNSIHFNTNNSIGRTLKRDTKVIKSFVSILDSLNIDNIFKNSLPFRGEDNNSSNFDLTYIKDENGQNIFGYSFIDKIKNDIYNIINNSDYQELFTDELSNYKEKFLELKNGLFIELKNSLKNLENLLNMFYDLYPEAIKGINKNKESFNDFIKQIFFDHIIGTKWQEWIKETTLNTKIDWDNEIINWNDLEDEDIEILSALLLQFLLRKNPSLARLRRVWETTEEFFKDIENSLIDDLEIPEWRRYRVVFDFSDKIEKDKEFKSGNLQFWAEKDSKKAYLITSIELFIKNLGNDEIKKLLRNKKNEELNRIFEDNRLQNYLNKDKLIAEEYFDKNEKEKITLDLREFEIQKYKPFVSITKPMPDNWQFIISPENITKFIDKLRDKYDKEFKYVYGKLPLHISIVVQKAKDPLYVGLKALRNMQNYKSEFVEIAPSQFCLEFNRKISSENQVERVNNPQKFYSLYWNSLDSNSYKFYIEPKELKKLSTLDKFLNTDRLNFKPNTIDFEFLDTNSKRNDIYYKNGKRDEPSKLKTNRPYSWEEFESFEKFKNEFENKTNELQTIISLIYSKMEDWGEDEEESFQSFIKTTFKQRGINIENFGIRDCSIDEMKKFIDMFEFWHTTLKEI